MKGKNKMTRIFLCFFLFFSLLNTSVYAGTAQDNPMVSVKLMKDLGNVTELTFALSEKYNLKESNQTLAASSYQIRVVQGSLVLSQGTNILAREPKLTIEPQYYGTNSLLSINQRPYMGEVQFQLENGLFIRPVNRLPLEDYLKGVVPLEMPASWEIEALKAQAVAARTYTMTKIHQVIDDTTNFQVYGGYQWHDKSTQAVEETRGQVLSYKGALIDAPYSSSNGGMTEFSGSIWNGLDYLPAQADPFDPQNKWTLSFQRQQIPMSDKDLRNPDLWWSSIKETDSAISESIKKWLQQNGYENHNIKLLEISHLSFSEDKTKGNRIKSGAIALEFLAKHDRSGYIRNEDGSIKVIHMEKDNIPSTSLRRLLGGGTIFKSYYINSLSEAADRYTIEGLGYGHGVGMSQYGAQARAKSGMHAGEILSYYYPGTDLSGSGSQVSKPVHPPRDIPLTPPVPSAPEQSPKLPDQGKQTVLASLGISAPKLILGSSEKITIKYELQQPAAVNVHVFDSMGKIRRVITNGSNQGLGTKVVEWDGYGLSPGNYTIVVEAKDDSGVSSNKAAKIELVGQTAALRSVSGKIGVIKASVPIGLRSNTSFQTKPIKLLKNGDRVQLIGKQDSWYKVKYGTQLGFVPDNYVSVSMK